jgi:Tol biopolymer transport system component/DNA-binding winged helix-turn-helix (wHTH) protein
MAEIPAPVRRPLRFSSFELDLQTGELRKAGVLVSLQDQSLKVLVELVERPGVLLTREHLRQRLWPNGTFVDYEHGLNAVINRLRETLGDSAESPRFIQTVPRRGYRFIAPVEGVAGSRPEPPDLPLKARKRMWLAIGAAGIVLVVAAVALLRRVPSAENPLPSIVALTRLAGRESGPAFAPDGEQVAFAWSGEKLDNSDIYVTLVGSTSVRRLTTDSADDFAPSWSPDGRRIAFLRKSGNSARIHLTSALGRPDSKLSDFPVGVVEFEGFRSAKIAWAPDGRHIVAGRDPRGSQHGPAGLYLIPVEGGEPRAITRPTHPAFDLAPTFSADGHSLAYVECESMGVFLPLLMPDRCGVRIIHLNESAIPTRSPRALAMQRVDPTGLAWSRDGQSIILAMAAAGPERLWRVWVAEDRHPERIEIAGESLEFSPATTGSRDRLAFAQVQWDSHLYRFNGALPVDEVAPSSGFETDPHFSPDGRWLAFGSGRSGAIQIWVAAADGSNPRQLTHMQGSGSPAWSPDGRSIAFDSGDVGGQVRIWIVDADGGTPRQITSGPGNQSVPRWSADGKSIYFANDLGTTRDIWQTPATGGVPRQMTRTGSGFVGYEFGDGTSLLYQPANGDSALLLMPLAGGTGPRRLVECVRCASFAPAGGIVVYVPCDPSSRPPLRAIDPLSGKDRPLGRLENFPPGAMHVNLAISPDANTNLSEAWSAAAAAVI